MDQPRIRFKGYTEDWELRKLGEVAIEFKSGISLKADEIESNGVYPVYGGNGLRGYTSTYNHDGEFALIGRQGALCGNMNYSVGKAYFTEHAIVVQANENNNTRFLYYLLDTMKLGQYSDQSAQPGLAVNKLIRLENVLPNKAEQIKISAYFSNLDHLITLYQRKCDETKKLKKYMLQKMFPQNGANVPEIRFDGFTDAWEQRKLGEVGTTYTGLSGKTKEDFGHGEGKFITYMNVFSNAISDLGMIEPIEIDNKQNEVKVGDVFFTTSSETPEEVGMSCVLLEKCENTYLNSFCFGYRPTEKFDNKYLAYMLRSSEVRKKITFLAQGISRYNISKNKMMEIEIPKPCLSEQKAIGTYFYNLDHLITLHQHKCEELQNIKKFMMQNMFV